MKIKKSRILCFLLSVMVLFASGCGKPVTSGESAGKENPPSGSAVVTSEKEDSSGKYAQTVSITTGKELKDAIKLLPDGETTENNEFYRYIKDTYNISVTNEWEATEGEAYEQKVSLAIASNDLPDMLTVSKYTVFKKAVSSGLVCDLTSVYEKYASPLIKQLYSAEGGRALNAAKVDGKLMGLVTPSITADAYKLLWLRKDWLDKLGLPEPKSMDDVINIAKAFRDNDPDGNSKNDTVAFAASKEHDSFEPIYGLYGAYPKEWMKDASGNVFYGSTARETKAALAKIREMYADNLIDKEFAIRKDPMELINGNKSGIFYHYWWSPWYPLNNSVTNDPKAEWRPYLAPLNDQGKFNNHMQSPVLRYLLVSKDCKNPEAVMKVVNLIIGVERRQDPMYGKFYNSNPEINNDTKVFFPVYFNIDYADAVERKHKAYKDAFEGKTKTEDLDAEGQTNLKKYKMETENPRKDIGAYSAYTAYNFGAVPTFSTVVNKVEGVFYGQTATMETKWANIEKFENEAFLKIIMGEEPLDYFDTFVAQWKQMGGDIITAEVQEAIK